MSQPWLPRSRSLDSAFQGYGLWQTLQALAQSLQGFQGFAGANAPHPPAGQASEIGGSASSASAPAEDIQTALQFIQSYGPGSHGNVIINQAGPEGRWAVAWKNGSTSTTVHLYPDGSGSAQVYKGGGDGVKNQAFEVQGGQTRSLPMPPPNSARRG